MPLLQDADGKVVTKKAAKPQPAAKVVAKPAPPVPQMVPNTPVLDEGLAYSLFGPKSGGGQGFSTQKAPNGGIIDLTTKDPNGYYWVDLPGGDGYWYRPEDGAEYRHTPLQAAKDAALGGVKGIAGTTPKGFNPSVVKGSPLKDSIQAVIDRKTKGPGDKWVPSAADMGAMDLAYSNVVGQKPQYTDADMASLDLGFSNAIEAAQRSDGPVSIAEGALPQGRLPQPGRFALPQPISPAAQSEAVLSSIYGQDTGPGGQGVGFYHVPGVSQVAGDPGPLARGLEWVPPNPDSRYTQEQEGYWRFKGPIGQTGSLELKPRGFSDLVTSLVPDSVASKIAAQTTNRLPGWAETPIEDALEFGTSPLGIVSTLASGGLAAAGGGSFARGAALDVASNFAGEFAEQGVKEAGGPGWLATTANLAGGMGPDIGLGAAALLKGTPSVHGGYTGPWMPDAPGSKTYTPGSSISVARQIDDILDPAGAARTDMPAWVTEGVGAAPGPSRWDIGAQIGKESPVTAVVMPTDLPNPQARNAWVFLEANPTARGAAIAGPLNLPDGPLLTSLEDQVRGAMAGTEGRLWYEDTADGAVAALNDARAADEYGVMMGVTTANKNPTANTLATAAAMEVRRLRLLDGTWLSAEDFAELSPKAREDYIQGFADQMGGVQTNAFKRIAARTYLEGQYEMGAVKSPSFAANLRQAGGREFGFASTNDRVAARMAGMISVKQDVLDSFGGLDNLVAQARMERQSGLTPWKGNSANPDAPALAALWKGLMDVFPGTSQQHYLTGAYNAVGKRLGWTPAQAQAAVWTTGATLFNKGNTGGIDWLLGFKPLDDALESSASGIRKTSLANSTWNDPKVQEAYARVKALDDRLRERGIDPYEGTQSMQLTGSGTRKVPSAGLPGDRAAVQAASARGAFPVASVSWAPGDLPGSPMQSIRLHEAILADPRIVKTGPGGKQSLAILDDVGIRHEIVVPSKISSWQGGAEAGMYVRLFVPDEYSARFAAALWGRAFRQQAAGLHFPDASAGEPFAGLRLLASQGSPLEAIRNAEVFGRHGLDWDVMADGSGVIFPNYAGVDPEDLAARVRAALSELGDTGEGLSWYNGHSSLVEASDYERILTADRSAAVGHPTRAGWNPHSPGGRPGLPAGLDAQARAYNEHVERIYGPPPVPGGQAAGFTGRSGRARDVARQAFGGTPVKAAMQSVGGAIYGGLTGGVEGAVSGALSGLARGAMPYTPNAARSVSLAARNARIRAGWTGEAEPQVPEAPTPVPAAAPAPTPSFRYPVEEPTPPAMRLPSPPPVPRAPKAGPAPNPAITPNIRKPDISPSRISPAGRMDFRKGPVEVRVDGEVAGRVAKSGDKFTASWRSPVGDVPFLTSKGAAVPFESATSAKNAVVNAAEQVKAGDFAAPRAAAAPDVPPAAAVAPDVGVVDEMPPMTELEAQLRGTLDMLQARKGVLPAQSEVREAQEALQKGATTTPPARKPTFRAGDIVRNRSTGELYEVASAGVKGKHMTVARIGGDQVGMKPGVFQRSIGNFEKVAPGTVPPEKMSYQAVVRAAEDAGLIPDPAVRQAYYRAAGTPEGAAAQERLISELNAVAREREALAEANIRPVADAIHSPVYESGVARAASGTASPAEMAGIEAIEIQTREAIGDLAFEESFPANHIAPKGFAPLADEADAAAHWRLVEDNWQKELAAENAASRVVRTKNRIGGIVVEGVNAPQTLKTSLDFSLRYRQGGTLQFATPLFMRPTDAVRHWSSVEGAMWRSLASEDTAKRIQAEILEKPRPGLHVTALDGTLSNREEGVMSSFMTRGRYNPIRRTSFSQVVMLNWLRATFYDTVERAWLSSKRQPSKRELHFLANLTNHATGRGTGAWLDKVAPALTIPLFSPRWVVSRFQLFVDPLVGYSISPRAGWAATRVLGANIGLQAATFVAVSALLSRAGMDYETDWRSSDFGQITVNTPIGKIKVDTTAGLQSPIRFVAQLASQSAKVNGEIRDRPAWETILRYTRSKASPNGGMAMDWMMNQIPGLERFTFPPDDKGIAGMPGIRNIPGSEKLVHTFGMISLDNAVSYFRKANSPLTYGLAAGAAAADMFGFSTQWYDKTEWEKRDDLIAADPAMRRYRRPDSPEIRGYDDLTEAGQLVAKDKYGAPAPTSAAGKQRKADADAARARASEQLAGLESEVSNFRDLAYKGKYATSPRDARDKIKMIKYGLSKEMDLIYQDMPDEERPSVVDRWRDVVDASMWPNGIDVDWDKVEQWEASLSPRDRKDLEEFFELAGKKKTGIEADAAAASKALGDAEFFDISDSAFKAVAANTSAYPELAQYEDFYEYQRTWRSNRALELQAQGIPDDDARKKAESEFNQLPAVKAYNDQKEKEVLQWMLDNPEAARAGVRWEYITPNDTTRGFLATGDPTQIITRQQEIETAAEIERMPVTTSAGTSSFLDASKTAWQAYARANGLTTPDGKSGADFASVGDFRDAGGEDDYSDGGSKEKYAANPDKYLRVSYKTNKDGSPSYEYISPAGKAQVEAILSLWKQKPGGEAAVRRAFQLDLPGFQLGVSTGLSKGEAAWLRQQGVEVPDE